MGRALVHLARGDFFVGIHFHALAPLPLALAAWVVVRGDFPASPLFWRGLCLLALGHHVWRCLPH